MSWCARRSTGLLISRGANICTAKLGRQRFCCAVTRHGRTVCASKNFTGNVSCMAHYSKSAVSEQETVGGTERHEFQAETKMLLNIVARSLYSEPEVFLRELISNASDALEKLRYMALVSETADDLAVGADHLYEIQIETDTKNRCITIRDTGIGMTKEELIGHLGTIARSGSKEFMSTLVSASEGSTPSAAESIIGQFGVGFYSAFMVADTVQVTTKSCRKGAVGYVWTSDGGAYEIAECPDALLGTSIKLHLKPGDPAVYAEEHKLKEIISKYSYFVTVPVLLNGSRVNALNAIWTMDKKDVTKDMYEEFFKHLAKGASTIGLGTRDPRPMYQIHYKADSPLDIRALLYVPKISANPLEVIAGGVSAGQNVNVALYARRVMIKPHAHELIPTYLRFLVGVVDSEDIPLNLSREMLQQNALITKLREVISAKVISFLLEEMKRDLVKYQEFYQGSQIYLKEGVLSEQSDYSQKENLAKLLLFESSSFKRGTVTSLAQYIERMQEGQNEIYFLYAPSRELAETSPYYESFKSRNLEVLFVYEPHDELCFLCLPQFQMKKIVSVEKSIQEKQAGDVADQDESGGNIETVRTGDKKEFVAWVERILGKTKVDTVKTSARQSTYPAMVTVSDMGAARHFLRVGMASNQGSNRELLFMLKPTLELNMSHPLTRKLMKLRNDEPKIAEKVLEQIYDNALVTAGLLSDSRDMVIRVNEILTELVTKNDGSKILTP